MVGQYHFGEILGNLLSLLYTKMFFRNARLIRLPIYMRGAKRCLNYGKGLTTGYGCRFDLGGKSGVLNFGSNVRMNDRVHIVAYNRVNLGDNVLIASNVFISDTSHGLINSDNLKLPPWQRKLVSKSVQIGDNVWIGEGVCILPGVTIGESAIIGAGAVVTKNIPARAVAAGVPAKVLRIL